MIITHEFLQARGACKDQREDFCRLFPNGVMVTRELCRQYAQLFDWEWAAVNLLSTLAAREVFHRAQEAADKVYEESISSSEQAYIAAYDKAGRKMNDEVTRLCKAYHEALRSAQITSREAEAIAFAEGAELDTAALAEEVFQSVDNWAKGSGQ